MKKKICFVTAARSEYGLLKWIMKDVLTSDKFHFQLIVTGSHLLKEQGHTIDYILDDGFVIDEIVDETIDNSSSEMIADTMGRIAQGFAKAFAKLRPDYVVVLGDRYELLPICNTAFVMRIPIIHLSGGDVTEGAIDDGIRNAVTMLSDYHFPGTEDAATNIIRMRGSDKNVWTVGEPGLDSFYREEVMTRTELADNLGLNHDKRWALMTYHPETKKSLEHNLKVVKDCISALLKETDTQTVATYANADYGGQQINEYLERVAKQYPEKIKVIPSLGHARYLSFMHQVVFVLGNSSSGIVEAPFLNIPVINIGDRQKGRHLCANVLQCKSETQDILEAVHKIATSPKNENTSDLNYWGDGHTSEKVVSLLEEIVK